MRVGRFQVILLRATLRMSTAISGIVVNATSRSTDERISEYEVSCGECFEGRHKKFLVPGCAGCESVGIG